MGTSSSARRAAILEAATRLFEHYGHSKTTIADVAREAQVGVGTVYLEFESKEAIVLALSAAAHEGVLEAMRAASAAHTGHERRLAAALEARTRSFLDLRRKGQHACELVHCKAYGVRAAHQRFEREEIELFEELITSGQRSGVFGPGAPRALAALIQRAFVSLAPPIVFGDDEDVTRVSTDLCRLLLSGLLAKDAAVKPGPARHAAGAAPRTRAGAPASKTRRDR